MSTLTSNTLIFDLTVLSHLIMKILNNENQQFREIFLNGA